MACGPSPGLGHEGAFCGFYAEKELLAEGTARSLMVGHHVTEQTGNHSCPISRVHRYRNSTANVCTLRLSDEGAL